MDVKTLIQQSIQKCQTSASDIRQAANQTNNTSAKSVLTDSASTLENTAKQMQSILTQL